MLRTRDLLRSASCVHVRGTVIVSVGSVGHRPVLPRWIQFVPSIPSRPSCQTTACRSGATAFTDGLSPTPDQLRRSFTWDRGKLRSAHAKSTIAIGIPVFFADPHSPWQRGNNENTNGVLRQYFPKGTDLALWNTRDELRHALFDYIEVFYNRSLHQAGLDHRTPTNTKGSPTPRESRNPVSTDSGQARLRTLRQQRRTPRTPTTTRTTHRRLSPPRRPPEASPRLRPASRPREPGPAANQVRGAVTRATSRPPPRP